MNPMIRLLLAATLLWSWLGPAAAQEILEASDMVRGGMQAIDMIDQGKAGELWDGAAPATRKRVTRAEFVSQVARSRAQIGMPQMRTPAAYSKITADRCRRSALSFSSQSVEELMDTITSAIQLIANSGIR